MDSRKTVIRFFTIADHEEEELWLHDQHAKGWKLAKMTPPCFFTFDSCTPQDVTYRLDFTNNAENDNYFQLFADYGWEYVDRCVGWLYFRKPTQETDAEQDGELFSDPASKIEMIDHVMKTRLLPLLLIFACCVLPNFLRCIRTGDGLAIGFTVFFAAMMLLYLYLLIYCGTKLQKLREKYKNG